MSNPQLFSDLDETLLRLAFPAESGFAFIRRDPFRALTPLGWSASGRAHLNERLAIEATFGIRSAPFDSNVTSLLHGSKAESCDLVLTTASRKRYPT